MKKLFVLLIIQVCGIGFAQAASNFCAKYDQKPAYMTAIEIVAAKMQYTPEQLCSLERLADIHVTNRGIYNASNDTIENHIWVTLHYYEYSCQYFVRETDGFVTKQNCYNTF